MVLFSILNCVFIYTYFVLILQFLCANLTTFIFTILCSSLWFVVILFFSFSLHPFFIKSLNYDLCLPLQFCCRYFPFTFIFLFFHFSFSFLKIDSWQPLLVKQLGQLRGTLIIPILFTYILLKMHDWLYFICVWLCLISLMEEWYTLCSFCQKNRF